MTELKGGLRYCTNCGFDGEKGKTQTDSRKQASQGLFWSILISPAALALCSYFLGLISDNMRGVGVALGVFDFFIGIFAAIYCGIWLAQRFSKSAVLSVLLGLITVFGLGFVYYMMIFAGCAQNMKF